MKIEYHIIGDDNWIGSTWQALKRHKAFLTADLTLSQVMAGCVTDVCISDRPSSSQYSRMSMSVCS